MCAPQIPHSPQRTQRTQSFKNEMAEKFPNTPALGGGARGDIERNREALRYLNKIKKLSASPPFSVSLCLFSMLFSAYSASSAVNPLDS